MSGDFPMWIFRLVREKHHIKASADVECQLDNDKSHCMHHQWNVLTDFNCFHGIRVKGHADFYWMWTLITSALFMFTHTWLGVIERTTAHFLSMPPTSICDADKCCVGRARAPKTRTSSEQKAYGEIARTQSKLLNNFFIALLAMYELCVCVLVKCLMLGQTTFDSR